MICIAEKIELRPFSSQRAGALLRIIGKEAEQTITTSEFVLFSRCRLYDNSILIPTERLRRQKAVRYNYMVREFHDSVITRFEVSKGRLAMKIESVWVADDEPREAGLLVVETVDSLLEDDVDRSTDSNAFGLDDGQILTLTMDETAVKMTVEWESYSPARKEYAEYVIQGRGISWIPC